jgi:hypothetical protein
MLSMIPELSGTVQSQTFYMPSHFILNDMFLSYSDRYGDAIWLQVGVIRNFLIFDPLE